LVKKGKVLTSDDFGSPKSVSVVNMRELVEGFGISDTKKAVTADFLNELVDLVRKDIELGRKINRGDVRKDLASAANLLAHAEKLILNSGILGSEILRDTAPNHLNIMFGEAWLNDLLPGHELLPTRSKGTATRGRSRVNSSHDVDMAAAGYYLMQAEGQKIIGAALLQISSVLSKALKRAQQQGGRRPIPHRSHFLLNLAVLWEEKLGRNCRSSRGQTFRDFCEAIFGYVGWPKGGIKRAIDKEVTRYYERSNRN
jgi:hypothetical protein